MFYEIPMTKEEKTEFVDKYLDEYGTRFGSTRFFQKIKCTECGNEQIVDYKEYGIESIYCMDYGSYAISDSQSAFSCSCGYVERIVYSTKEDIFRIKARLGGVNRIIKYHDKKGIEYAITQINTTIAALLFLLMIAIFNISILFLGVGIYMLSNHVFRNDKMSLYLAATTWLVFVDILVPLIDAFPVSIQLKHIQHDSVNFLKKYTSKYYFIGGTQLLRIVIFVFITVNSFLPSPYLFDIETWGAIKESIYPALATSIFVKSYIDTLNKNKHATKEKKGSNSNT